ncbi:MAG TPA: DUF4267 domain-containing protein [Solirubrobacterales bacterium]|jgi:hypothetical protein
MSEAQVDAPDVRAWSVVSGLARIAFGVGMLAAPERALRPLGFSEVTPATVAVTRVAGVRDLVLGLVTVAALFDRDRLRAATLANTVADAGDTLAFGIALSGEEREAGLRGVAAALPAAVAGIWTRWRLR